MVKEATKYERNLRLTWARTFGPSQKDVFYPIRDQTYNLHHMDDITIGALGIALVLKYIRPADLNLIYTDFSTSANLRQWRFTTHYGAGLRTPDGQAFVAVSYPKGRGPSTSLLFEAIGERRSTTVGMNTKVELFDPTVWAKKYANYQDWIDHLMWSTDKYNVPKPIPGLEYKLGATKIPAVMPPPGWPMAASLDPVYSQHEDYRRRGGKSFV